MNLMSNEIVYLGLFFYALGFGTLAVAGFKKTMISWIAAYGLIVGSIVWFIEAKWFLMGGIVFMLLNQFYAAWSISRKVNQCMTYIKAANDEHKRGNNHDNK